MSRYNTGTIAVTNGGKIVTGVGTKWTNSLIDICAGQMNSPNYWNRVRSRLNKMPKNQKRELKMPQLQ